MGDEIASMRLQLKEAMDASKDIEGARVRNQRLRVETERLKRKLKASKSYSLHKALNATVSSSKEHADKLRYFLSKADTVPDERCETVRNRGSLTPSLQVRHRHPHTP